MKRILAFLLLGMLIVSQAGCGSGEAGGSNSAGSQYASSDDQASDPDGWPVITTPIVPTQPIADEELVEGALNDYLISINAGVLVDIIPIEFGNLNTTLTLMLASRTDPIDLFSYNFFSSLTNLVTNDQVIPLDDYVAQYPEVVSIVDTDFLPLGQLNGVQYALPTVGAKGAMSTYGLRLDIAEAIGVADRHGEYLTLRELTDILLEAKRAYPDLIYIPLTGDVPEVILADHLGDTDRVGVLMDRGIANSTVTNLYTTQAYREFLDFVVEWEAAGLLLDDPLNQELTKAHVKTGVSGGCFDTGFSIENSLTTLRTYGYDFTIFQVSDLVSTAGSSAGSGYCISSVCQNLDAAMKLLSLMFTDATVMRYFAQGIEDVHYVVDENGCSWYPEGQGLASSGWATGAQWYFPNQTLCIPFEIDNPNYYVEMLESNAGSEKSVAVGFIFDNSDVYNEATAVSAVVAEYRNALEYGQVDVETYLPQFLQELEDAGIDSVIAEKQAQLDTFLAS